LHDADDLVVSERVDERRRGGVRARADEGIELRAFRTAVNARSLRENAV
jgi:hypothetical protein